MFKTLLILVLMTVISCGKTGGKEIQIESDSAIIDGDVVRNNDVNFRASLVGLARIKPDGEVTFCTGTFIKGNIILTAAHCIPTPGSGDKLQAIYSVDLYSAFARGQTIKVRKSVQHPTYRSDSGIIGDIGLAVVDKMPAGATTSGISFKKQTETTPWMFHAVGYGNNFEDAKGKGSGAGVLRHANLFGIFYEPTLSYFAAGNTNGKMVCHGDSGGPALVLQNGQSYVVGVAASIASKESDLPKKCTYTGYYENVEFYKEWIESEILKF